MKKRVKLLTTIASLCLAVALMAFGVYAATSASFGVKSSVSFTVGDNLAGKVTVTQYVGQNAQGTKAQQGSLSFSSTDTISKDTTTIDLTTTTAAAITPDSNYVTYVIEFEKVENTVSANIDASNFKCGETEFSKDTVISAGQAGWTVVSETSTENNCTIVLKYTGTASADMTITFDVEMTKWVNA